MCKKIKMFILTFVLLFVFVPVEASAEEISSGTCGENLSWTLSDEGVLTIFGSGEITSWRGERSKVLSIVIEDGVTTIGDSAFNNCSNLTSVSIPDTVTAIGDSAFVHCSSLTNVSIPNSVTTIGTSTFNNCSSLTNVNIPDSVITIGRGAFFNCSSLTNVSIPNSVTSIGDYAFNNCSNLTTVSISNSVTTIEEYTFDNCSNLTSVSIPDSVTTIEARAFSNCSSLTTVSIPNSVATIEFAAFEYCSSLTDVSIPNSVTAINAQVFAGCSSLTNINIPDSVTMIVSFAFNGCSSLTNVSIPNSVTMIGDGAFYKCSSLTNISIPDSVTYIGGLAFGDTNLNKIVFWGNATTNSEGGRYVFSNVTATAYYPAYDKTWTEEKRRNYDGNITWVGYNKGENPWEDSNGGQESDENDPSEEVITPKVKVGEFFFCDNDLAKLCAKKKQPMKYTYYYDDAWFLENSSDYNHELAQMSIRTALAGFNANTTEAKEDNAYYIKALMKELGYSYDDNSIHYPDPNKWTIGYAIGRRDISSDTTVLMVTVRGGGYKGEWYSNCIVGETGDHQGFDEASVQVGDGIYAYINAHAGELKENVKVWIVGYSRAAAVANLTAADLCNGFINGISSEDVFAYCFACPQGTIDSNAASNKYSSIKNIINPIDLVPKVAMSSWDFTRYGVTYYLPYAGGDEDYLNDKTGMRIKYDNILSNNGLNNIEERTKVVLALTTESPAQAIAYMDIVNELACLVGNRYNYVNKLIQGDVAEAAYVFMGKEDMSPDTWMQILLSCNAIFNKYNMPFNMPGIMKQIVSVGEMYKLQHPGESLTGISEQIGTLSTMDIAHYPALYMAWLDSLNGSNKNYNGKYVKVFINCPVDVTIYDKEDDIVGKIVNNEVVSTEEGCTIYIDQDGQKIVVLPCDADYQIQMAATDNGTVTYTVEKWNMDEKNSHYLCSYYDVNVERGNILTGLIEEADEASAEKYTLLNSIGEKIEPTKEFVGEEIVTYSIHVEADGHGVVNASSRKTEGEYVIINAVPNDNESFLGWYNGEALVSAEENYRFRVEADVSLTAKFTKQNHNSENGTIIKSPTCTENGVQKYTCDRCNETITESIDMLGHSYDSIIKEPNCSEEGYTTHICERCNDSYVDTYINAIDHTIEEGKCIQCGEALSDIEAMSFWDKITNFLLKIVSWVKNLFK